MKDATVLEATGKIPEAWFEIIKNHSKPPYPHKEIADFLHDEFDVSYWWAQEITVLFEKNIGKRVLGQTEDGLFQIGVSKTLKFSIQEVWDFLTSKHGLALLLGDGLSDENLDKPEKLEGKSADGIIFKMTTFHPGSHFRMQWQDSAWEARSILQIRFNSKDDSKTTLSFHQEKLPDKSARDSMKQRWQEVAQEVERRLGETNKTVD